jgi:hypothetical protein
MVSGKSSSRTPTRLVILTAINAPGVSLAEAPPSWPGTVGTAVNRGCGTAVAAAAVVTAGNIVVAAAVGTVSAAGGPVWQAASSRIKAGKISRGVNKAAGKVFIPPILAWDTAAPSVQQEILIEDHMLFRLLPK